MHHSMKIKRRTAKSEITLWKNEAARQRWELFHRAIAHAKASNVAAMDDDQPDAESEKSSTPYLYIAR